MARKQITYAHRKNKGRNKLAPKSCSSPLQSITDSEENLTHSEMARRMLKRSRHSGSIGSIGSASVSDERTGAIFKKVKLDEQRPIQEAGFPANYQYELQTPHPTILTEAQIFKLESSRGRALPSDYKFSPVPMAPSQAFSDLSSRPRSSMALDNNRTKKSSHRTSSSNLKENSAALFSKTSKSGATSCFTGASFNDAAAFLRRNSRSKSRGTTQEARLASPFNSRPPSPYSSPKRKGTPNYLTLKALTTNSKRALSDTHFNPNLPSHRTQLQPQTQSTTNSPVYQSLQDDFIKARRPSAPSATAQRPYTASWFGSCDTTTKANPPHNRILSPSIFEFVGATSRGTSVDFNRPPSQLSYNSTYDETFFGDALRISTPFKKTTQQSGIATFPESPDSIDEEDGDRRLAFGASYPYSCHTRTTRTTPPLSLDPDILGPWMSDSLISPPTLSLESAYIRRDKDVDMTSLNYLVVGDEGDALGLVKAPNTCPIPDLINGLPGSEGGRAQRDGEHQEALQELFESLDLGLGGGTSRPPVSRTRSLDLELDRPREGQPLQSPAQISPAKTRHTAVDTAKGKQGGRDRRGTIRASDFPVPASSVATFGGPRRTRSGTIVQGPTHARRERSDTILARPPASLVLNTSAERLSDDGDGQQEAGDVLMCADEAEDELLLKDHWCDEDWVVAEPPSPELPRRSARKRKGAYDWKKGRRLWEGLGTWGMEEHDEDDGKDDPLNLLK